MCCAVLVTIQVYYFSSSECYDGSVRLVGGENAAEGIVELCRNFRWGGTVCDMGWDDRDAVVACRNAGFFGGTLLFYHDTSFGLYVCLHNAYLSSKLVSSRDAQMRLRLQFFLRWGSSTCSR